MITEIYAHILDEDRKVNAQKFEAAFYSNADMRYVEQNLRKETYPQETDTDRLMVELKTNPNLMDTFTQKFIDQYGEKIMAQLARKMIGA